MSYGTLANPKTKNGTPCRHLPLARLQVRQRHERIENRTCDTL
jgi:hypothetical protein